MRKPGNLLYTSAENSRIEEKGYNKDAKKNLKKRLTATGNCGILTELSQEYILNIQFKQFKKLKKVVDRKWKM